jgi:hypothetical protein
VSDDLRYPIGKFRLPKDVSDADHQSFIKQIAEAPTQLREAVSGLGEDQLATPYRPDGWTVRQVVHHVPDSHLNGYVRIKLALTENEPTIKTYNQPAWADLDDARNGPIDPSLQLLESLHDRWVRFLRTLEPGELQRSFKHPEWGLVTVGQTIALYAWHGRHHVAHITSLRERRGWT